MIHTHYTFTKQSAFENFVEAYICGYEVREQMIEKGNSQIERQGETTIFIVQHNVSSPHIEPPVPNRIMEFIK